MSSIFHYNNTTLVIPHITCVECDTHTNKVFVKLVGDKQVFTFSNRSELEQFLTNIQVQITKYYN